MDIYNFMPGDYVYKNGNIGKMHISDYQKWFDDNEYEIDPVKISHEFFKDNNIEFKNNRYIIDDNVTIAAGTMWWHVFVRGSMFCTISYISELQHILKLIGLDEFSSTLKVK